MKPIGPEKAAAQVTLMMDAERKMRALDRAASVPGPSSGPSFEQQECWQRQIVRDNLAALERGLNKLVAMNPEDTTTLLDAKARLSEIDALIAAGQIHRPTRTTG